MNDKNNWNHNSNAQLKSLWKIPYFKKKLGNILGRIDNYNNYAKLLSNEDDLKIYYHFFKKYNESISTKQLKIQKKKYLNDASEKRVSILKKLFNLENKTILDVGTEDCHYINLLNKKNTAYGINVSMEKSDIESYQGDRDCIIIYDGENIPFSENLFDIITITMVIHHIDNPIPTLKNIYKVLKPGGFLFIKEHDVQNKITNAYIDFIHFYYELIANTKHRISYYKNYTSNYMTKHKLQKMFNKFGFKNVNMLDKKMSIPFGAQRKYYAVFKK